MMIFQIGLLGAIINNVVAVQETYGAINTRFTKS